MSKPINTASGTNPDDSFFDEITLTDKNTEEPCRDEVKKDDLDGSIKLTGGYDEERGTYIEGSIQIDF